jgi:F0F1-type ATP synthase assembly protein I
MRHSLGQLTEAVQGLKEQSKELGTMRHSLGQLTEAVQGLKEQSKEQGKELKEIGKDLHAAKVVVSVVGGLIILVGGAIAWLVNTYISTHPVK